MTETLTSATLSALAQRYAATFGTESEAIAQRVRIMADALDLGATDGKSLEVIAREATHARIVAAVGDVATDSEPYRLAVKSGAYSVGKSTVHMYGKAARVIVEEMGVSLSLLTADAVHAVFRTTANRAGITDYRAAAIADILKMAATDRAAAVLPRFTAAYLEYQESQRKPQNEGTPPTVEETAPATDSETVERNATPDVARMVPASADVILHAIDRMADDIAALSDDDTVRVFAALDALYETVREVPAVRAAIVADALADATV